MKTLYEIFGYCVIPKNTFLFRGHQSNTFEDCMFFATKHWVAGAFNDSVQVWKTTKDIRVLFLVDKLNNRSWATSSLPQLYNKLLPLDHNPNFTDLDIKHWDIDRRNKLVEKLFNDFNISGWLTSLENVIEIEVCLFNKHNNNSQLVLVEPIDNNDKKNYKDSLEKIWIEPSRAFFHKTKQNLDANPRINNDNQKHYDGYKRIMNYLIKYEIQNGSTRDEAKHSLFNLRTKLKI